MRTEWCHGVETVCRCRTGKAARRGVPIVRLRERSCAVIVETEAVPKRPRASALPELEPFAPAEASRPSLSHVQYRRVPGTPVTTVPDKPILRTGVKPTDAMVMIDLYAAGSTRPPLQAALDRLLPGRRHSAVPHHRSSRHRAGALVVVDSLAPGPRSQG